MTEPNSKATQTILPGAAYLWMNTVVLGNVDDFSETPFVVDADGNTHYSVPADLVLLYTPGDDVTQSDAYATVIERKPLDTNLLFPSQGDRDV